MFIWTNMFGPGFTLIFLGLGFLFVLYSFAAAFRERETRRPDGGPSAPPGWPCRRTECRAINPPHARFCRMCGRRRD